MTVNFYKINSQQPLEWKLDDNPTNNPTIFAVIISVQEREHGTSTFIMTNAKLIRDVKCKFNTPGHITIQLQSQFDTYLETNIPHLSDDMTVIGLNALRTYLTSKSHQPYANADLTRILSAAEIASLSSHSPMTPEREENPFCLPLT